MTSRKNDVRASGKGNNPHRAKDTDQTDQDEDQTDLVETTNSIEILNPLNFDEFYMSVIEHPRPQTMAAIKELEGLEEALPPKPADPRHLVEADGGVHVVTRDELDEFRFLFRIYLSDLKDLYEARGRLWAVIMDHVGVEVKQRLDSNHKDAKLAALTDNRNVVKLVKILEQVCDELAVNRASIYRNEIQNAVFDETEKTFTEFVDWYDKKVTAAQNGGEYFSEKDKAWYLIEALEPYRAEIVPIVPDAYAVIKTDPRYPTFEYIRDRVSTYFTGKSRYLAGKRGGASSGNSGNTKKRERVENHDPESDSDASETDSSNTRSNDAEDSGSDDDDSGTNSNSDDGNDSNDNGDGDTEAIEPDENEPSDKADLDMAESDNDDSTAGDSKGSASSDSKLDKTVEMICQAVMKRMMKDKAKKSKKNENKRMRGKLIKL